jgi:flagellar L-ring protein FlgH
MRRLIPVLVLLAAVPALAGRRSRRMAEPPPPPEPPVIESPVWERGAPGSMLTTPAARRMVGQDGFSRQPGDIVTVVLVEQTSTSLDANTETSNASGNEASVGALFGLEGALALGNGNGDLGVSTSRSSTYQGAGRTGRGSRIDSVVSCTVTEVLLPMLDYRIWCSKQVRINRETQWVVLQGRIRARDIRADNTIPSNLVAHAEIEVTGRGVVDDKQRPPLLVRILDAIWPF